MSRILFMSSGAMVWALHFGAVYGLAALACARGWQRLIVPSVAVSTALAVAAILAILVVALRGRAQFEWWMAAGIAAFALLGIVWGALAVLMVPACG